MALVRPVRSSAGDFAGRNAYVVVLRRGETLLFEGCLELQVLAGLLHAHGHVLTPTSPSHHHLFSPTSSPYLPLTPIDPCTPLDGNLQAFLTPLSHSHVIFTSSRCTPYSCGWYVNVDLDSGAVEWLNRLTRERDLRVACVCLVWKLDTKLVSTLQTIPGCGLLKDHSLRGFNLLSSRGPHERIDTLSVPGVYHMTAKDILEYKGPIVLVCGDAGTGKSTFCRYLLNSLLNGWSQVGYLECDVGQSEFTVAGVIALHLLTQPVFGPPYTHPRQPYKAFYFGHCSPAPKPSYYIHLIQQLHSLFMKECWQKGEVPLIINTCGWVTDLGVPLMMDVIRLLSPTHIIRLVPNTFRRNYIPQTDLLPFTPHTLTSTPGILTLPHHPPSRVKVEWTTNSTRNILELNSKPQPPPHCPLSGDRGQKRMEEGHELNRSRVKGEGEGREEEERDGRREGEEGGWKGRAKWTVELGDDSQEIVCLDSDDSCEPESDVEIIGYDPPPSPPPQHTLPHPTSSQLHQETGSRKRRRDSSPEVGSKSKGRVRRRSKRLMAKNMQFVPNKEQNVDRQRSEETSPVPATDADWYEIETSMTGTWVSVLEHRVCVLRAAPGARGKDSRLMRRLAMVAHFSPLNSCKIDHTHFLKKAPVIQFPWKAVAIHVLHMQVPQREMLYAMRGKYVALGRVDAKEIVEQSLENGVVRFLSSHTPLIEFLAMGVLRGACPEKQLYYVTTPLYLTDSSSLDLVNVLVMADVGLPDGFSTDKTMPTSFRHTAMGQLAWRQHH